MTGNSIESRLLTSFWDDGLLDILVGIGLLATGLAWAAGSVALAPVCAPILIVLWRPLRERIVEPRAGYVRFTVSRRRETRLNLLAVVAVGLGTLAVVMILPFLTATGLIALPDGRWASAIPAGIVAFGLAMAAALTGATRFYWYAAGLVGLAQVFSTLMDRPEAPLIAGGTYVLLSGMVRLAKFIRQSADFSGESA